MANGYKRIKVFTKLTSSRETIEAHYKVYIIFVFARRERKSRLCDKPIVYDESPLFITACLECTEDNGWTKKSDTQAEIREMYWNEYCICIYYEKKEVSLKMCRFPRLETWRSSRGLHRKDCEWYCGRERGTLIISRVRNFSPTEQGAEINWMHRGVNVIKIWFTPQFLAALFV